MRSPFRTPAEPTPDAVFESEPASPKKPTPIVGGSAILPRNFTVTAEDRVRGIVQGVPAFARRRRHMEDLEAELVTAIAHLDDAGPPGPQIRRSRAEATLERLNRLIDAHNRYYPIEANLPNDLRTGRVMDRGQPWAPLPRATLESIGARRAEGSPSGSR